MDNTTRERIAQFIAQYDTLVIATEDGGQPYATRVFFVEDTITETGLILYGTFITTSRKLANLRVNPRVGLFIGPTTPSQWLEATAHAHVIEDEATAAGIRARLGQKSPTAAAFIARVPVAAVELRVRWLRMTDLTGGPIYTEITFETQAQVEA